MGFAQNYLQKPKFRHFHLCKYVHLVRNEAFNNYSSFIRDSRSRYWRRGLTSFSSFIGGFTFCCRVFSPHEKIKRKVRLPERLYHFFDYLVTLVYPHWVPRRKTLSCFDLYGLLGCRLIWRDV